jgi:hypothetical protein
VRRDQQIAAALLDSDNNLFYQSLFRNYGLHGNAHGNNRKPTMRGVRRVKNGSLLAMKPERRACGYGFATERESGSD